MWIVELALRRRYTFIVVALLIFIIGPLSVLRTPTDIFPNIDIPVLSIVWSFNGFSAEDMAHRVTSPVERALTTDVDNIEHIESQSLNGVAVIKVFFHPGADINRAIAEAAANSSSLLRNLPPGILPPLILSYNASTVPILQLALTSKTLPEQELYDYGNNFIRTQLATVQGAAVPLPFGGKVRQIMVDIDSRALQARGLSPLDVVNAVNAQNLILPGGTAKIGALEYNVNLNGSTQTVEALNDLLQQTVAAYQSALDIATQRFAAGVASDSDVALAQTQLQTARSQLIDFGVVRAQLEHAIATLIGEAASTFALPPNAAQFAPPDIPSGVPSQLLERRPDVAAAERLVAASNADVGAATAAFFPDLMLSLTGGLESGGFSQWASAPSRFWAVGLPLVGTLFDGGLRKQKLNGAKASYESAVADYRQVVLTSFQEVEDNLAAMRILADESVAQQLAVNAAQHELDLAMQRYQGGAVGYLEVVTAQSMALTNERTAIDIARRRLDASVLLVKALGGIWG